MNSNKKLTGLFNPLPGDFKVNRFNDANEPYELLMPSGELSFFPKHEADFLEKRLLDELYNLEGDTKIDRDLEYQRLREKIKYEE